MERIDYNPFEKEPDKKKRRTAKGRMSLGDMGIVQSDFDPQALADRQINLARPEVDPVLPNKTEYDPFQVFGEVSGRTRPQQAGPNYGILGESFGIYSPEDQQRWLKDEREKARASLKAAKTSLLPSSGFTTVPRSLREANAQAATQKIGAAQARLRELDAMERGELPLPVKSGLRSAIENFPRSVAETVISVPEMVGIVKGYIQEGAVDDESLLNWSRNAKAYAARLFPGDPARQNEFGQVLANGLGSMVTFYGTGIIARLAKLSLPAQTAVISALGGAASGTQGFEEATAELQKARAEAADRGDQAAIDDYDRLLKTVGYSAVGLTEALPIARTLSRTATPSTRLGQRFLQGAESAAEEAAQESGAQLAQNLISQQTTDPDRDLGKGVAQSAAAGGVLGGLMGFMLPGRFQGGRGGGGDVTGGAGPGQNIPLLPGPQDWDWLNDQDIGGQPPLDVTFESVPEGQAPAEPLALPATTAPERAALRSEVERQLRATPQLADQADQFIAALDEPGPTQSVVQAAMQKIRDTGKTSAVANELIQAMRPQFAAPPPVPPRAPVQEQEQFAAPGLAGRVRTSPLGPQMQTQTQVQEPSLFTAPQVLPSTPVEDGDKPLFAIGAAQTSDIDALGYYSKALEEAKGLKQDRGTPEQMLAQLRTAGVKDAEIQATGLDRFIASKTQPGQVDRPVVTKQEIVDYLDRNRVQLQKTVYGGIDPNDLPFDLQQELRQEEVDSLLGEGNYAGDVAYSVWFDEDQGKWTYGLYGEPSYEHDGGQVLFDTEEEAGTELREMLESEVRNIPDAELIDRHRPDLQQSSRGVSGSARWGAYSLDPGNPTYRENVIHLPMPPSAQGTFRSGHWDEPNIIAHARTQELNTADGRRVLNLDELQSDWGQKVREGDVRDEEKIADLKRRHREAQQQLQGLIELTKQHLKKLDYFGFDTWGQVSREIRSNPSWRRDFDVTDQEAGPIQAYVDAVNREKILDAELRTAEGGAPGHPLVRTTDQWVTTALRNVIQNAVDAGVDGITITPGVVQNDRYDLTNKIEALRYVPKTGGLHGIRSGAGDNAWSVINNPNRSDGTFTAEELPDTVGQELSGRLLQQPVKMSYGGVQAQLLRGIELEVGGEGMRATYDRLYPRALQKILRKMDKSIKPERVRVVPHNAQPSDDLRGLKDYENFQHEFTYYPITDKIRQKILEEGQPLFAIGAAPVLRNDPDVAVQSLQLGAITLQNWQQTLIDAFPKGAGWPGPDAATNAVSAILSSGERTPQALRAAMQAEGFTGDLPDDLLDQGLLAANLLSSPQTEEGIDPLFAVSHMPLTGNPGRLAVLQRQMNDMFDRLQNAEDEIFSITEAQTNKFIEDRTYVPPQDEEIKLAELKNTVANISNELIPMEEEIGLLYDKKRDAQMNAGLLQARDHAHDLMRNIAREELAAQEDQLKFSAVLDQQPDNFQARRQLQIADQRVANIKNKEAEITLNLSKIEKDLDDVLFALRGFYQPSIRAVEQAKQEKATPEQWKKILTGPGVRQAEVNWMGILEWLDVQASLMVGRPGSNLPKSQKTLTRDQVLDFMRYHNFEVEQKILLSERDLEDIAEDQEESDVEEEGMSEEERDSWINERSDEIYRDLEAESIDEQMREWISNNDPEDYEVKIYFEDHSGLLGYDSEAEMARVDGIYQQAMKNYNERGEVFGQLAFPGIDHMPPQLDMIAQHEMSPAVYDNWQEGYIGWKAELEHYYDREDEEIHDGKLFTTRQEAQTAAEERLSNIHEEFQREADAYRESLNEQDFAYEWEAARRQAEEEFRNKFGDEDIRSDANYFPDKTKFRKYAIKGGRHYQEMLIRMPVTLSGYTSHHFKDSEVVHIRYDVRDDEAGKKTLLIHEIQSDLHQHARAFGYGEEGLARAKQINESNGHTEETLKALADANLQYEKLEAEYERYKREGHADESAVIQQILIEKSEVGKTVDYINEKARENSLKASGYIARFKEYGGAPRAPFTGNAWWELGFKAVLQRAVEKGMSGIALTTPQQISEAIYTPSHVAEKFYGQSLPRFISKYVKKWGSKQRKEPLSEAGTADKLRLKKGKGPSDVDALIGILIDHYDRGGFKDEIAAIMDFQANFSDYLRKDGGDLVKTLTSGRLGVSQVLDAARYGVVYKDKEGYRQKYPAILEVAPEGNPYWPITDQMRKDLSGEGTGQPLALSETQIMMGSKRLLASGRAIEIGNHVKSRLRAEVEPHQGIIPKGLAIGYLKRIEPIKERPSRVNAYFETMDGRVHLIEVGREDLFRRRAFYQPADGGIPSGIFFIRFGAVGDFTNSIIGEMRHEAIHALRRRGFIPAGVWSRLVDHAKSLQIMNVPFGEYLEAIGRKSKRGDDLITLGDVYEDFYQGRTDYDEIINQEFVAHMAEMYSHGILPDEKISPISSILDDIFAGRYSGRGTEPGAAEDEMLAIRAFHGSSHDFDRFDISRIGTGEGAQAFGHGLYFAENELTARDYQIKLGLQVTNADALVRETMPDLVKKEPTLSSLVYNAALHHTGSPAEAAKAVQMQSRDLRDANNTFGKNGPIHKRITESIAALRQQIAGQLYEVEIDVEPEQLLDYDAPLGEQPKAVREGILKALGADEEAQAYWLGRLEEDLAENGPLGYSQDRLERVAREFLEFGEYGQEFSGRAADELREAAPEVADEFMDWAERHGGGGGIDFQADTGRQIYNMIVANLGSEANASEALRKAGVPGIRYLDQGSRDTGEGTRNIVLFDDSLVKITKKNGNPVSAEERHGVIDEMFALRSDTPQILTPEFRNWFKGSKVVDEKGEPLVVYHGTGNDVSIFDVNKATSSTGTPASRLGFFFSSSGDIASSFAPKPWMPILVRDHPSMRDQYDEGANVLPVYLSIKNPFDIQARDFVERFVNGNEDAENFANDLKDNGYDGVRIVADRTLAEEFGGSEYGADAYVAFEPTQIKSVFNRGEFNPDDPNILAALAGVKAKRADKTALASAKQMKADGKGQDEIWKETGWIEGLEGEWRFEIPDFNSKVKITSDRVKELARTGKRIKLKYLLDHPDLYENYPEIANIPVRFSDKMMFTSGQFNKYDTDISLKLLWRSFLPSGVITLGTGPNPEKTEGFQDDQDLPALKKVLHHEIQHKIQFIEGFAAGSSTPHERDLARQKIVALKLKPADINILSSSYNGRRGLLVLEQLVNLQRNIDDEKLRRDLDRVINAHIDKLALFLGIHLYQRSAGEIESREIERRSIKPPEALKQTRPSFTEDFRKEEIIIRDQEGFPPGENGKILRTLRDRAMQMEKARIDNSIIFKQTGWYRDENGQWSFKMNSDLKKIIQKMKGKQ